MRSRVGGGTHHIRRVAGFCGVEREKLADRDNANSLGNVRDFGLDDLVRLEQLAISSIKAAGLGRAGGVSEAATFAPRLGGCRHAP